MRKAMLLCLLLAALGNAQDSLASRPVDSLALLREALANHKAYIENRVAIGKGFYTYYAIQDRKLGWGLRPDKEIELASRIGSETESSFRTARTLNRIALPLFVVGYGMFLYSGMVDRTDDHDGTFAIGGILGLTGAIGWATGYQKHKSALYRLDRDLRKHYRVE